MKIQTNFFFSYHANSGGKTINVFSGNNLLTLTYTQFRKLAGSFNLPTNDKLYRIESNNVIGVK